MVLTATEFKANLGKYLDEVGKEEIIITKNGRKVAELVPAKISVTDSLIGLLKDAELPEDFEEKYEGNYRKWIREMRMEEKYGDYL